MTLLPRILTSLAARHGPDAVTRAARAASVRIEPGAKLRSYARKAEPDQILLHESVTRTTAETVAVLSQRKLGVHYMVDLDAEITRHVDPRRATVHAVGHNDRSVAVEEVNAYYGARAVPGETVISAVWAHKGRYIMPPPGQLEATWRLVQLILAAHPTIPLAFPGVTGGVFYWGRVTDPGPGILAHHRTDHADGLVPEHYCWARSQGLGPADAYEATLRAASSGVRRTTLERGVA